MLPASGSMTGGLLKSVDSGIWEGKGKYIGFIRPYTCISKGFIQMAPYDFLSKKCYTNLLLLNLLLLLLVFYTFFLDLIIILHAPILMYFSFQGCRIFQHAGQIMCHGDLGTRDWA